MNKAQRKELADYIRSALDHEYGKEKPGETMDEWRSRCASRLGQLYVALEIVEERLRGAR